MINSILNSNKSRSNKKRIVIGNLIKKNYNTIILLSKKELLIRIIFFRIASKPINIRWIRTDYQPY